MPQRRSPADIAALAGLSRRDLFRYGALLGTGAALGAPRVEAEAERSFEAPSTEAGEPGEDSIVETSIADLQAAMRAGALTSEQITELYLERIAALDHAGPTVNSVMELNPAALGIARARDRERRDRGPRGPLHGIPILLKGNIDTADRMQTTAGSLALLGDAPAEDSTVAAKLRQAGAVILGKSNLSEWANLRSFSSASGWSAVGGQTRNPYRLDRNPCGSSAGSAASVAASFCAAGLGTETDGSIVCPASANGVVGIKPTLGLTSRAGVVPIADAQDVVGPHGRTVADAAAVLGALTGVDPRDPATAASAGRFFTDYTQFVDPNGLEGARIGVFRNGTTGYSGETDLIFEQALAALAAAGATLVDPADPPTADAFAVDPAEIIVLVFEFKRDLNAYLATRTGVPVNSLAEAIAFNLDHVQEELRYFGQEWFELAQSDPFDEATYLDALERGRNLAGRDGLDAILDGQNLDALVAPTGSPAWPIDLINGDHFLGASSSYSAVSGYPALSVPAGFAFGLPVGVTFMGRAWSEPTLIRLAAGFEHAVNVRRRPRFRPSVPLPGPGGVLVLPDSEALGSKASGPVATRPRRPGL
jgi:amidase